MDAARSVAVAFTGGRKAPLPKTAIDVRRRPDDEIDAIVRCQGFLANCTQYYRTDAAGNPAL